MDPKEIAEEKRKAREDRERADAFVSMLKTPGWSMYVDLLNKHIGSRMEGVLNPTPSGHELLEQHNKGVVYGLITARDLPNVTIAAMNEQASSEPADGDK